MSTDRRSKQVEIRGGSAREVGRRISSRVWSRRDFPRLSSQQAGGGQAVARAAAPVPAGSLEQEGGRAMEIRARDGVGGPHRAQVRGDRRRWEYEPMTKAVLGK